MCIIDDLPKRHKILPVFLTGTEYYHLFLPWPLLGIIYWLLIVHLTATEYCHLFLPWAFLWKYMFTFDSPLTGTEYCHLFLPWAFLWSYMFTIDSPLTGTECCHLFLSWAFLFHYTRYVYHWFSVYRLILLSPVSLMILALYVYFTIDSPLTDIILSSVP